MFISIIEVDKKKISEDYRKIKAISKKYLTKETIKSMLISKISHSRWVLNCQACPQFPNGYTTMRSVVNVTEGKKMLLNLLVRKIKIDKIEKIYEIKTKTYIEDESEIKKILEDKLNNNDRNYRVIIDGKHNGYDEYFKEK